MRILKHEDRGYEYGSYLSIYTLSNGMVVPVLTDREQMEASILGPMRFRLATDQLVLEKNGVPGEEFDRFCRERPDLQKTRGETT